MMNSNNNTWEEKEKKNKRNGMVTTITIHTILLILFIFLGLTSAYPPPMEGILINFGTTDTGRDPVPSEVITPEEVVSPAEAVPEPPIETVEEVLEEIITQDVTEAPAVVTEEKNEIVPVEEEPVQEPIETVTETQETEEDPEEIVEEPIEVEPEPKADPKSLYTGSKSDEDKPSNQGIYDGKGDQGVETGDPASDNYEGIESHGLGNSGVGYDLTGRDLLSIPPIKDKSQETGKVAVKIKVDRNGNILYAKYTTKGSTTTDAHLIQLAEKAARDARFNGDNNAPEEQWGTIVFTFKLK